MERTSFPALEGEIVMGHSRLTCADGWAFSANCLYFWRTKNSRTFVRLSCLKKNPARSSADKSNLPLRTGGCPANGFMLPHRTSRVDPDGAVCNPPPDSRL